MNLLIGSFGKGPNASAFALKHELNHTTFSKCMSLTSIENNVFSASILIDELVEWNVSTDAIHDAIQLLLTEPGTIVSAQASNGAVTIQFVKDGPVTFNIEKSFSNDAIQISFPIKPLGITNESN